MTRKSKISHQSKVSRKRQYKKRERAITQRQKNSPESLIEGENLTTAIDRLIVHLKKNPTDIESRRLLARCYFDLHCYADAISTWQVISPPNWQDLLHLGTSFFHLQQWDQAIALLEDSLKQQPDAHTCYQLYETYHHRTSSLSKKHSPDEMGKDIFKRIRAEHEEHIELLQRARVLLDCPVEVYLKLHEWYTSQMVNKLERCSKDEEARCRQEWLEASLRVLEEAFALYPDHYDVQKELAETLLYLGHGEKAIQVLSQQLQQSPAHENIVALAVAAAISMEHYEEAIKYIDMLTVPTWGGDYCAGIDKLRGDLYLRLQQVDLAHACYLQESRSGSFFSHFLGLFSYAWTWHLQDQDELAITCAQQAADAWFQHNDTWERDHATANTPIFFGEIFVGDESQAECIRMVCEWLLLGKAPLVDQSLAGQLRYLLYGYYMLGAHASQEEENTYAPLLLQSFKEFPHPFISKTMSRLYLKQNNLPLAVKHHLICAVYHCSTFPDDFYPLYAEFSPEDLAMDITEDSRRMIHQEALAQLQACSNTDIIKLVFAPFYSSFWRSLLLDGKLWLELAQVTRFYLNMLPSEINILKDAAVSAHMQGHLNVAEQFYRRVLVHREDDPPTLALLAQLLSSRKQDEEALRLAEKAVFLDPNNEQIIQIYRTIRQNVQPQPVVAQQAKPNSPSLRRLPQLLESSIPVKRISLEQQQKDFFSTAPLRWPQLDRYKRQILGTLTMIGGFQDWPHLAKLTGMDERYLKGHWQKLIDLGMILEEPTGYAINPSIIELAKREQSHAVVTRIIHASSALVMKPIFNSQLEYQIYTVLLELFSHHLIFPNIALQAIFQYERMKASLDGDLFGYFLRASVDFCITSTVTYLPVLTFEVDSSYHDLPKHQLRDEKKDTIFALGGVPLLRLRIFGQPSIEAIRHDIIGAVRTWEQSRLPLFAGEHELTVNIEQEIDFEAFGRSTQPTKD